MKAIESDSFSLSVAARVGLGSFLVAILLLFIDVRLSAIPLAGFVLICMIAPFCPRYSFYLPVISRGTSGKNAVALTFDDGPDPLMAPQLLDLLARHDVNATFFVTGKKAAAHPEIIKQIVRHGHSIGNHSYSHDFLLPFKGSQAIVREIESTQEVLSKLGLRPLAFRPPAGITSPGMLPALLKTGQYIVNYSCRPLDGGNRRIKNIARKILKRIRPDDIILLHDNRPNDERLISEWLKEVESTLSGLKTQGFTILPLSELIGKPVMITEMG